MADFLDKLEYILEQARSFNTDAQTLLSKHGVGIARLIDLKGISKSLGILNIKQEGLIREALDCAERGNYRASHVMAWSAFIDYVEEQIVADLTKLSSVRPNWRINVADDLIEIASEYEVISTAKAMGMFTKNQMKSVHGLLSKRNECAHPTGYDPGLDEALGYIAELLKRIRTIESRINAIP
jgi:hypothetical protein